MKNYWIKKVVKVTLLALLAITVLGYVIMGLWNGIVVELFAVKSITYWQALGLFLLSKIFFGGFKKSGCCCCGFKGRGIKEKWNNMTDEEKEKFKEDWRLKCSSWKRTFSSESEKNS